VDSGFCKFNVYNLRKGIDSLVTIPISKASAIQRAGRVGRNSLGICFRLYSEDSYYTEFYENFLLEILRVNLESVVLVLVSLGFFDILNLDLVD